MKTWLSLIAVSILFIGLRATAQETVFNVPSGDILDRGKVYTEFDFSFRASGGVGSYTPRAVVGLGHGIEGGANINNITSLGPSQTTITPTFKWKLYDGRENGWSLLAGENLFIPVQNRSFDLGTWTYAEFAKTLATKTRLTFGGYYFSANVVSPAQRGGGQFAVEQPAGKYVTFAADWFTGSHSAGYVTPGAIVKLTSKVTWYISYEIGNAGLTAGNHQFLTEVGWNIN
jgi:hypothetical protein